MRDRELVQRVLDATDLVALVGQAVKLRKQGSAWVGLCPFHGERTPSFRVVQDRGFYHCFGCGKHGDALSWTMEREGLSFPEALEQLARAAGISLPAYRERPAGAVELDDRLRGVMELAQAFYTSQFGQSDAARRYLSARAIQEPFAREVGLGWAPEGWDRLVTHLRQQGVSAELMEQSGLASRTERGSQVDFLRNRITIPIHDARGRIVAFGGRGLGDEKPKYLNTRESPIFHKSDTLFGFHRAKGALRDGGLVVEGYFDVLQLHQQGLPTAVAPLGTALTEGHLRLLGRFTKRVVLCFDGDAAGQRAMEKSLKLALPLGFDVRFLVLPEAEDPDTWCRRIGAEAFRELLQTSPDWTSFMIDRALEGKDLRRLPDRLEALRTLTEHLAYLPASPERRELLAALAHQLQLPYQELERAVRSRAPSAPAPAPSAPAPALPAVDDLLRPFLARAFDSAVRERIARWPEAWWEGLQGTEVLQAVLDWGGDPAELPPAVLTLLRALEAGGAEWGEAQPDLELAQYKLELAFVQRELQSLSRQIQSPTAQADPRLRDQMEGRQARLLERKVMLARNLRSLRTPKT